MAFRTVTKSSTSGLTHARLLLVPAVFLGACLALTASLVQGETAGWLLMCIAYLAAIALGVAQVSPHLSVVLVVVVTIRWLLSLLDVHSGLVRLTVADAMDFHANAARLAATAGSLWGAPGGMSTSFYTWLLSRVYIVFGPHVLVGQAFSTLAYVAFCWACSRVARSLGCSSKGSAAVVLVFSLLPSTLRFTAPTLREAWKLALLAWLVHASLALMVDLRTRHIVSCILAAGGLLLFHKAFVVLSPLLLALLVPFVLHSQLRKGKLRVRTGALRRVIGACLVLAVVGGACFLLLQIARDSAGWDLLKGDLIANASAYRSSGIVRAERTVYGVALDTTSFFGILRSSLWAFFCYLAAPFPWQIAGPADLYAWLDALGGLAVLAVCVARCSRTPDGTLRLRLLYILVVFIAVSGVHALGTVSWGTSIRHRLLTNWMLLAAVWPAVARHLKLARHRNSTLMIEPDPRPAARVRLIGAPIHRSGRSKRRSLKGPAKVDGTTADEQQDSG